VIDTVSHLGRTRTIDRIVALEDYDVEMAATLREHLRVPGMGETTSHYFRDKLAMRVLAREKGLLVPEFVHALNYDRIREFTAEVPPPWVLKPRSEAATVGIRKVYGQDDLWPMLDELGDRQSYFVLEQYVPGEVFHIDAIISEREVVFAEVHRYGSPPLDVVHEGGVHTSSTMPRSSGEVRTLNSMHRQILAALGFVRGVTHTEFIRGQQDGHYYFLETAARVGGAHVADLVQAATGINLWTEWARLEIAGGDRAYSPPQRRFDYAGLILSLARQERPDTNAYSDPEIVWRLQEGHHAGLVVCARDPETVNRLLDAYRPRFYDDFFASLPAPEKPTS
jgi:biotin carboxylase